MYTTTQLEVIRVFGRKELSFGCIVKWIDVQKEIQFTEYIWKINEEMSIVSYKGEYSKYQEVTWIDNNFEILWHIPHLEDVFRVAKEKWWLVNFTTETNELLFYRKDSFWKTTEYKNIAWYKTIPLLEQPESVLIQILNLFK